MTRTVITYDGIEDSNENCVFIRGKYYNKRRDCVLYDGIYYSPFSRYLVLDNETGVRCHLLAEKLNFGIIAIDGKKYISGYYSSNMTKNGNILIPLSIEDEEMNKIQSDIMKDADTNQSMSDGRTSSYRNISKITNVREDLKQRIVPCMDIEEFLANGFHMCKNSDLLVHGKDIEVYNKMSKIGFKNISAVNPYSFDLAYNSEVMMDKFQEMYSRNNQSEKESLKIFSDRYLGKITFGVEYETWDGRIPQHECARNGLIPLKDGSLRHDGICGNEYATVVMSGPAGLSAIKRQCDLLRMYCAFNEKCSMHIHIGSIPKSREALELLYKGFLSIQASMYSMFPECLSKTSTYKQKDYCSPLPNIKSADDIVKFLSDGNEKFSSFGRNHPKDSNQQNKWHINSRYVIFNLNNYYYTKRGTAELRISTPTFNHNKVIALLTIFSLIISEALNGRYYTSVMKLIKGTISDAADREWMENYIEFRMDSLSAYVCDEDNGVRYYETMNNDNLTSNNGKDLV